MNKERELLRRIHYCWVGVDALEDESDPEIKALNEVMREAEHYLFHEPKEPEDEHVAWVDVKETDQGPYEFHGIKLLPIGKHNLYTRPAQERKRISQEEADKAYQNIFHETGRVGQFWDGIRFAEKHHGIGEKE